MVGYGDVPVKEVLLKLKQRNFDGYVSLEWVKRWNSDLEEAAIAFPQFINYVRRIIL